MNERGGARITIVVILLILVLGGGAGWYYYFHYRTDRIADVKGNPRNYMGKTIEVEGVVTDVFSLAFISYFQLDDGTGAIAVITKQPLPAVGEKIRVKGTLKYFSLGTERIIALEEK